MEIKDNFSSLDQYQTRLNHLGYYFYLELSQMIGSLTP